MANDRWDYDDPYRPRRYGDDEEYERNFWQDRPSREHRHSPGNPVRRYESTPVLGMDMGGARGRGDWCASTRVMPARAVDTPATRTGRISGALVTWSR